MGLTSEAIGIRRFVLEALRLAGAAYSQPDAHLIVATCPVTKPGGIFTGPRVVMEDLQLVFDPEGAGRHPSAELVCPGSYRLRWFVEGVRARGFVARQFYPEDFNTRRIEREILQLIPPPVPRISLHSQRRGYIPFLLAVFKLTALADDKREELLPLAMNLRDGSYRPGLPERLRTAMFQAELPYQRTERRRLPWREVWRSLREKTGEHIGTYGSDWYQTALARLAAEGEQMRRYFQEMLTDAEDVSMVADEYRRRLEELREKYNPVIKIKLANVAVLYLPVVVYTVEGAGGRPLPPIRYEPAAGYLSPWNAGGIDAVEAVAGLAADQPMYTAIEDVVLAAPGGTEPAGQIVPLKDFRPVTVGLPVTSRGETGNAGADDDHLGNLSM